MQGCGNCEESEEKLGKSILFIVHCRHLHQQANCDWITGLKMVGHERRHSCGKIHRRTNTVYVRNLRFDFSPWHNSSPLPVGWGLSIFDASRSHSDTPHGVGLLWTSDQP